MRPNYTSPNDGIAYGVIADWGFNLTTFIDAPKYLAIIDLAKLLAAPRIARTHTVDPAFDLLANGVLRYVDTN